jgi:8-oxo-dGTP pyrophosphatase MutT (NUDIX family)
MYIKIYFNDKPLFLCDELTDEINLYAHHDDAIFIDEFSTAAVNSMIHEMRREKVHAGIFYHDKLEDLKKAFWKKFQLIQAAGGLVQNGSGDLLFIFRRNKWDLPKGKLDRGETLEQCALREVKEETGLRLVKLGKWVFTSHHAYDENGKHNLKETSWYNMTATQEQGLIPQEEEQITEIRWADKTEMQKMVKNTYPLVKDVIRAAGFSVK